MGVDEAVYLAVGMSIDDVNGILTSGHKNLRAEVKVQRDDPLLLVHGTCKLLAQY